MFYVGYLRWGYFSVFLALYWWPYICCVLISGDLCIVIVSCVFCGFLLSLEYLIGDCVGSLYCWVEGVAGWDRLIIVGCLNFLVAFVLLLCKASRLLILVV